jgi:hypothetical protein
MVLSRIVVRRHVINGFFRLMNRFIEQSSGGSTNTYNTSKGYWDSNTLSLQHFHSYATSTHRRTFSARPRVGMCRQCARPRATNVRHSGRVRATVRLMSVSLFRIKGRSCPNTRKHERPDYTSRAAQFSCTEVTS